MSLAFVKKTYEVLGQKDPFYAVLSDKRFRNNKWDPDAFFETGRQEIRETLDYVDHLGLRLRRQRALDFGCGVGRLSQALGDHFHQVVGVDISESMVETARRYNRHSDRVRYLVNPTDNLQILDDDSFDLVYSNITLQHIPPELAGNYIQEFFRVLHPGGLAIFQVPSGRPYKANSLAAWFYTVRRRHLRRAWRRVRGRPPVEIHYVARAEVQRLIDQSGGRLLHVAEAASKRKRGKNFRYCATK